MQEKGFIYTYNLKTCLPQEYEAVTFAFLQAGWNVVGIEPEDGYPATIIFEWNRVGAPNYPDVNWT